MKELKVYVTQDGPYGLETEEGGEPVEEETCYLKSDVDAVIAEYQEKILVLEKSYKKLVKKFVHETSVLQVRRLLPSKGGGIQMKTELIEIFDNKLEDFVGEILNDKQKRGENDVIGFENVQLKYLKGFLDGMCTALECNYQKEGDYWVIRDGRKKVVARQKEAFDD